MPDGLSLDELSRRTGEAVGRLNEWRDAGLIGQDAAGFTDFDVEKVHIAQLFLRRGVAVDAIASAVNRLMVVYGDTIVPGPRAEGSRGRRYSLDEAAQTLGIDVESLQRFWQASALGMGNLIVTDEEIDLLRYFKLALDAGMPEEAMLQMLRVYADALARVGEAEQRIFRFHIRDRLTGGGPPAPDMFAEVNGIVDRLRPVIEPAILYFHRRGLAQAAREDLIVDLAEQLGLLKEPEVLGQVTRAVAFVDLSSFTPLAAEMGDVKAAQVLDRFAHIVREAALQWEGRIVKQIGDEFMLVFTDAASAVACLVEIERLAAEEPQFPAVRGGVHWGPLLYREGDYLGSNVNIASRLTAAAERHQVLVTADVRREAAGATDLEFVRVRKRRLKGLTEDIELYEARLAGQSDSHPCVDPVCGVELRATEIAASLSFEGREWSFCSQDCLRKFVLAPEKYAGER